MRLAPSRVTPRGHVLITKPIRFLGWWILAICGVAVFTGAFGLTYTVSVYVDPMLVELGLSRTLYSLAYAVGTGVGGVVLLLIGRPLEHFGSRWLMVFGALGLATGLIILSFAAGPWWLFVGFPIIRTFGQGTIPLAARILIPNWFYRQRARAFSLLGLATTASIATLPLANGWLIDQVGWRNAWRIASVLIVLIIIPLVLKVVRERPEDVGQLPDGEIVESGGPAPASDASMGISLKEARQTTSFWILVVAGAVPPLITTGQHLHQAAMFVDRGTPGAIAAATFTIEAVSMLAANLGMGWLNTRINPRIAIGLSLMAMVLTLVALLLSANPVLAVLYGTLRGGANGAMTIAVDLAWPGWYGRRHLASLRTFGMAAHLFGSAMGPLPFGIAADLFGGYPPAIIALMALPLTMSVLVFATRPPEPPRQPESPIQVTVTA
jgi:MFS family permease